VVCKILPDELSLPSSLGIVSDSPRGSTLCDVCVVCVNISEDNSGIVKAVVHVLYVENTFSFRVENTFSFPVSLTQSACRGPVWQDAAQ